ncbi:hypothetical protein SLEP1_g48079 [Rubroshorea leprosula]|uniref:Uncharacterized protein n=1 Tax=Rubroshorea leprosula TaxID=152421 RepID=A0AAV5LUT4_9ROSI|nr:hypothetical protein SLEP1_g48079 [Rubroshorea leprosula]
MQGLIRGVRSCWETVRPAIIEQSRGRIAVERKSVFSRFGCATSESQQEKGLENVTVAEILMTKGEEQVGSWLWCRINDTVDDAMKNVGIYNILGSRMNTRFIHFECVSEFRQHQLLKENEILSCRWQNIISGHWWY